MTTSTQSRRRARDVVELGAPLRRRRAQLASWAIGNGRPLTIDAASVILAVREFESNRTGLPPDRWSTADITTFIWGSAVGWCHSVDVAVPERLAESLWTYLAFLGSTDRLARGSSRTHELLDAVSEAAGLDRSGRSSGPPTDRRAGVVTGLRRTGTADS